MSGTESSPLPPRSTTPPRAGAPVGEPVLARIIAVVNQKGGTGKTTTTVNLAAALGRLGRRVLVVDLDPQGNASAWLGGRDTGTGLRDALTAEEGGSLEPLLRPTPAEGVELIASSPHLALAEKHLSDTVGGDQVLGQLLRATDLRRWSFVLIDCPPALLSRLTLNALAAAAELLVPVEASAMAVAGLADVLRTHRQVQLRLNARLALCGIVACRVDARTRLARSVLETLRERFPDRTLATTIRESIRLREAWGHLLPIDQYAPQSAGAADYGALAREILNQERRDGVDT